MVLFFAGTLRFWFILIMHALFWVSLFVFGLSRMYQMLYIPNMCLDRCFFLVFIFNLLNVAIAEVF